MKRVVATLLLLTALASACAFSFPRNPIDHTLKSIVRIASVDPESGEPTVCTGFVVAPKYAITAAHCIVDPENFTVDGERSVLFTQDAQFALVAAGDKPALKLTTKLRLQEPVITFGYAWGDLLVFSRRVAIFKDADWAMDGPLAPGMSGGPTVNQAGEVVGLNQAANSIIGIDCGVEEIQQFLNFLSAARP